MASVHPGHRLYIFDLDDNLLSTSCCVLTTEGRRISTKDYACLRDVVSCSTNSFDEFKDVVTCAVSQSICFPVFKCALRAGHPIAIVTARSNCSEDIRFLLGRVVPASDIVKLSRLFIYCCGDVSNPLFSGVSRSEDRKALAVEHFIDLHPQAKTIGYSDDDRANIRKIGILFEKFVEEGLRCYIYDSSVPAVVRKCTVPARTFSSDVSSV